MTLLKSSTCCLNGGTVKLIEIFVYKQNFNVFTREVVLINKINMSFAHE